MTLECCDRMAATLWSSESMLDEAKKDFETIYGTEIGKISPLGMIEGSVGGRKKIGYFPKTIGYFSDGTASFYDNARKLGFWEQYGIPKSKKTDIYESSSTGDPKDASIYGQEIFPALYPTRMDMNFLFGVGQEHGKRKLRGWQERSDIPRTYNNTLTYSPNTEPPNGAILRDLDGRKAMKCPYASDREVKNGKKKRIVYSDGGINNYWKRFEGEKTVLSTFDSKYPYDSSFKLSQTIPEGMNDFSGLIWSGVGDGKTHVFFNYLWVNENVGTTSYLYAEQLINTSLKLTKHADLLTNEEVQENYIVINSDYGFPVIPLKKGVQYYIFAECKNGGFNMSNQPASRYYQMLGGMSMERTVKWPRWDD